LRNTILIIAITIFALGRTIHAQPDSLWSRTFGGIAGDECFSVIQTSDRGYLLGGKTRSFGDSPPNMWVVKTDDRGDSLWSRVFGGGSEDKCYSVVQADNGGFVLTGSTESYGSGRIDMWLVKTDADGDSLWSRTYGGTGLDWCSSAIKTADGGYALFGTSDCDTTGAIDMWLVKTNADGDSLWSQTYGGENQEYGRSIIQTSDGGFLLGGETRSFGAESWDMYVVKTDADGEPLWSRRFGGESMDKCDAVIEDVNGEFALAGFTHSFGAGRADFWLIKTDTEGDSLWSRTYGGEESDISRSAIQSFSNGFIITGFTSSFGSGDWDMWLLRTDSGGDSLWSMTFGGNENEVCYDVIRNIDGGYTLAGYTKSIGSGYSDMWLVKTGPDPVSAPSEPFNSHPSCFVLQPAYPNPFNSTTTIKYNLPYQSNMSLKVYNTKGQQITTLFEGHEQPGIHTTTLTANNLPTGLYFLRLKASDQVFTQKVMLIR